MFLCKGVSVKCKTVAIIYREAFRCASSAIRLDSRGESKNGGFSKRALALRCNNRKVVTLPHLQRRRHPLRLFSLAALASPLARAHMRAWGKGQPPWKNHGFTRQIAYAYKAVLFRALTHRRVYLTDIPIHPQFILCGVLYLFAAGRTAMENTTSRFSIKDAASFGPLTSPVVI